MIPPAFEYSLPVIRGVQARREYYIAMCPVRLLPKLFPLEQEKRPPQARSQRQLDRRRVPKIARYILDNPDSYTTSAIAVSIDGDLVFEAIGDSGDAQQIGRLRIPMEAKFIINDGQHRMAALQMALQDNEALGEETVALVLFVDTGLQRSQQRFSDLNRFVVRPPNSLNILYDRRDPDAEIARQVVDRVALFRHLTETERNTLPKRSPKLFTLSGIYQANVALLNQHRDLSLDECVELASDFWSVVGNYLPEWEEVLKGRATSTEIRQSFLHCHTISLVALATAGAMAIAIYPDDWETRLEAIETLDWKRSNPDWEGKVLLDGRISKSRASIGFLTAYLKRHLGLPLTPEEEKW